MKVNVTNGAVCASGLDLRISGFVPIEIARHYTSNLNQRGSFGYNWNCPLDSRLIKQGENWDYQDPAGSHVNLKLLYLQGDPWTEAPPNRPCLFYNKDRRISLLTEHKQRIWFGQISDSPPTFFPNRIEDRNGNAITYLYKNGRLAGIQDEMGRELRIEHTAKGFIRTLILLWNARGGQSRRMATYEYDDHDDLVAYVDALGNRWLYSYHDHLLISEENPLGGKEYAYYDSRRRCIATFRSDGSQSRLLAYDDRGGVTRVRNARGNTWIYRHDQNGRLVERCTPLGDAWKTYYDSTGGVIGTTEAGATRLAILKDSERSAQIVNANGASTTVLKTPDGLPQKMVDAFGNAWHWEYDRLGNLIKLVKPSGASIQYRYERGFVCETIDENGVSIRKRLDRRDGAIEFEDDLGLIIRLEFDVLGLLISATDALKRRVVMERDAMGRITSVTDSNGWRVRYHRDANGNPTRVENADGESEQYTYDKFGKVIAHVDALGRATNLEYGPEDVLLAVTTPDQKRNEFEYDELERVISQRFFDGRRERYEYDAKDGLVTIRDAGGRAVKIEYDDVGFVRAKQYSDGTKTSYVYDALRRLVEANEPGAAVAFEYDADGNILKETQNDQVISYSYDAAGNCTQLRTPAGTERSFQYDTRRRVIAIEDPQCGRFEFAYDETDHLRSIVYPNNAKLWLEYDGHGKLAHQYVEWNFRRLLAREYRYDKRGRLHEAKLEQGVRRYEYDAVEQLLGVVGAGAQERYRYDAAGNLIESDSTKLVYDANGRLQSFAGTTIQYGAEGFPDVRLKKGERTRFKYDGEGRLKQCWVNDQLKLEYTYDASSRLLGKSNNEQTTAYLWSGSFLLEERKGDGTVVRHLYHPQLFMPLATVASDGIRYYIPDWKRMVIASIDEAGKIEPHDYSAFGTLKNGENAKVSHPFRLPGQIYDADAGLHYNRFRFYLPEAGRFLTPDPLGLFGNINLYAYASNPVHGIDWLGLCDGEVFYRAMSDKEVSLVMADCQLKNKPEAESPCHEAFVTQRKDYSEKLQQRHPDTYPKLVEFCCQNGTAAALQNPAIAAVSDSPLARQNFPSPPYSYNVQGPNIIHLKYEQVNTPKDKALNYGLRRGRTGEFNSRIKNAKVQPNGPECTGPAAG
jgi:RHS repeat-associated protein